MSPLNQSPFNPSHWGKLVVLRLEGDLEQQGFQVILEMSDAGARPLLELQGRLPADPTLATLLKQWQQSYRSLAIAHRITPKEIIYGGSIHPIENCRQLAQQLHDRFSQWLDSESFQLLNQRLREELNRDQPARFLLRSANGLVRQLPWSTWNLVDRYPHLEIALSPLSFEQRPRSLTTTSNSNPTATSPALTPEMPRQARSQKPTLQKPTLQEPTVKILAIIGNSEGIDTVRDRQLLEALPQADVTFLVEPQRQQITDHLWQQAWDILFFAGHSQTEAEQGRIYINRQDSLTLSELKYGLQRSIDRGLQLAIFNSCDGLGLAQELEQLQIPHLIVMRQPVPDRIAQAFLTYFLSAFAQGEALDLAERQARERLQGWEHEFPCASWLPVLTQNPAATPLSWQTFRPPTLNSPAAIDPAVQQPARRPARRLGWKAVLVASSLVTSLVMGVRSIGWLQPSELSAFDQFLRWRPAEVADPRLLVVTVDEADIQYQDQQGMARRGSLSDEALAKLLDKLQPYQPSVVALDIYHDFAFTPALAQRLQQTANFVAVCQIAQTDEDPTAIAPPPGLAETQIGFADIPVDSQYVIRRQLLGMPAAKVCPTSQSLSLQIALNYLAQQNVPPLEWTENREVKIGSVVLPKLGHQAGGYQLPPLEANGYQVLLNYRAHHPQQIPLRVLLSQSSASPLTIAPRSIVLIGVNTSQDLQFTPFGQEFGDRVPGVVIQAQMVSQIISAVLERRSLIWWLPEWGEGLWIASWSIAGGGLALWWVSRGSVGERRVQWMLWRGLELGVAIGLLVGGCFVVFLQGGWIPLIPAMLGLVLASSGLMVIYKFS